MTGLPAGASACESKTGPRALEAGKTDLFKTPGFGVGPNCSAGTLSCPRPQAHSAQQGCEPEAPLHASAPERAPRTPP